MSWGLEVRATIRLERYLGLAHWLMDLAE